jgi:hypothetical protein
MEVQYFGHYDSGSGNYKSFYTSDIWPDSGSYTTPYIELTYDEWQEALSTRCRVIDSVHTNVPYTSEEETQFELNNIRRERDNLLIKSDWVLLPHSPITGSKLDEWVQYRQDLRDITSQTPPYTLPTKPE